MAKNNKTDHVLNLLAGKRKKSSDNQGPPVNLDGGDDVFAENSNKSGTESRRIKVVDKSNDEQNDTVAESIKNALEKELMESENIEISDADNNHEDHEETDFLKIMSDIEAPSGNLNEESAEKALKQDETESESDTFEKLADEISANIHGSEEVEKSETLQEVEETEAPVEIEGLTETKKPVEKEDEQLLEMEELSSNEQSEVVSQQNEENTVSDLYGTDEEDNIIVANIMELLVRAKAPKYIKQFGNCDCKRCTDEVVAEALCNLPPKYLQLDKNTIAPRLDYYYSLYEGQIMVEVTKACMKAQGRYCCSKTGESR